MSNPVVQNTFPIVVSMIKSNQQITRVTEEFLISLIETQRVFNEENRALNKTEKDELFERLVDYFRADLNWESDLVELEKGSTISDPRKHVEWKSDESKRLYWKKQREHLRLVLGKKYGNEEASRIINSIDIETNKILESMEDPSRPIFDSRGLVVGYVQSGKTANFTALISKAVDAGYRFIIVLAGIHNELRQQTQIRIDKEITGFNNLNLDDEFVQWDGFEQIDRFYPLTSAGYLDGQESGEFSGIGVNNFSDVFIEGKPVLAIIKKNVKVMERLIKWIANSSEKDRKNVPLLVIDDEADQASIDTNANKNEDPTKTNAKLRTILSHFQRKAYVGYTATPFANVFIKYDKESEELGEDLYPRNFIHSLPEPFGYFGTRKIFHVDLDKFFVERIASPKVEMETLTETNDLSESLIEAINVFIVSMAIRYLRGDEDEPMSMMINVDHRVNRMNRVGEKVKEFINNTLPRHYSLDLLKKSYNKLKAEGAELNDGLETTNNFFTEKEVIEKAVVIINSKKIVTRILNSSKDDKLDYVANPEMKVIAIGGNKLSRGLTLEGLMTTYYLRNTKQFDTLLQMGRWFGYRFGYEDLVRIYTSENLWMKYRDLAIVELEFREEVKQMVKEEKTPEDFFIGVRQIIGMLPTGRDKMGKAVYKENLRGSQLSVKKLQLEHPEIIETNFSYLQDLINKFQEFDERGKKDYPSLLARNVSSDLVNDFLKRFMPAKSKSGKYIDYDKENLLAHLDNEDYPSWNVALISGRDRPIHFEKKVTIRAVNRARMKNEPDNGSYNIKSLAGSSDRKIDLHSTAKNEYDGREKPLLLLFVVDKNSVPRQSESTTREPLYEGLHESIHRNPPAFTVVFPGKRGAGVHIQED